MIEYLKRHPAIIITLITACLYMSGLLSYSIYLEKLGIEESNFQLPIDRLLFYGFYVILAEYYVNVVIAFTWAFFAWLGVFILIFIARLFYRYVLLEARGRITKDEEVKSKTDHLAKMFERQYFFMVGLFGFVFLPIFIVISASGNGKASAGSFIKQCQPEADTVSEIFLKDDTSSIFGCSIVCNTNECVYLWEGETFVVRDGVITSRRPLPDSSD